MLQNIGTADRVIRIVVGLVLLSLTVIGPHTKWGLLGLVPLLTATAKYCPLYSIFHMRTNRGEAAAKPQS